MRTHAPRRRVVVALALVLLLALVGGAVGARLVGGGRRIVVRQSAVTVWRPPPDVVNPARGSHGGTTTVVEPSRSRLAADADRICTTLNRSTLGLRRGFVLEGPRGYEQLQTATAELNQAVRYLQELQLRGEESGPSLVWAAFAAQARAIGRLAVAVPAAPARLQRADSAAAITLATDARAAAGAYGLRVCGAARRATVSAALAF